MDAAIWFVNSLMLALLAALLVASLFLVLWITRSVLTPFRRLRLATRLIGEGQFEESVDAGPADEEMAELMESFNDMAVQLRRYRDNLIKEERFRSISSLATSVTHEVNNPLTIISGNAEFVRTAHAKTDPSTAEQMTVILEEVRRISKITNRLSRIKQIMLDDYQLGNTKQSGEGTMVNLGHSAEGEAT